MHQGEVKHEALLQNVAPVSNSEIDLFWLASRLRSLRAQRHREPAKRRSIRLPRTVKRAFSCRGLGISIKYRFFPTRDLNEPSFGAFIGSPKFTIKLEQLLTPYY